MPRFLNRTRLGLSALAAASAIGAALLVGPAQAQHAEDPFSHFLARRGGVERPASEAAAAPALEAQPSGSAASSLVISALNFLDVRYRRGGDSVERGFDCSGFTRHVFEVAGLLLPRRSQEQAAAPGLQAVPRDELQPGDLVFFNTLRAAFSHVGIYVGEGRFIHAPRSGASVRVEDMRVGYWRKRYNGARRALDAAGLQADAATAGPPPGSSR
jgi:cell wall-associated NlpC family hydrolase